METLFEDVFRKAVRKHSSVRKQVQRKVEMIIERPLSMGEPLKGNYRWFYSCPVRRNFIIIYLYCKACRAKGDDVYVACSDCHERDDETLKFVLLGPHDEAYGL